MAERRSSTPQQLGRVKDARGRQVTQLDPVMMHMLHRHDVITPEVLREMAGQVGIGMTRATRVAFWAGLAAILCCGIALAVLLTRLSSGTIRLGEFAARMLPYSGTWIGPLGFWVGARRVRTQRTTRVMLEHLRCPHCGYDIHGLPTDPLDGTTVCPECGCAWKLEGETE